MRPKECVSQMGMLMWAKRVYTKYLHILHSNYEKENTIFQMNFMRASWRDIT
jgi:hypothetical protein